MSATTTSTPKQTPNRFAWRVVDIVVASVIGVASGLIFVVWNVASNPVTGPLQALLPGLQAVGGGFWLFAGVLTALVIRKPGARQKIDSFSATVESLARRPFSGGPRGGVNTPRAARGSETAMITHGLCGDVETAESVIIPA